MFTNIAVQYLAYEAWIPSERDNLAIQPSTYRISSRILYANLYVTDSMSEFIKCRVLVNVTHVRSTEHSTYSPHNGEVVVFVGQRMIRKSHRTT